MNEMTPIAHIALRDLRVSLLSTYRESKLDQSVRTASLAGPHDAIKAVMTPPTNTRTAAQGLNVASNVMKPLMPWASITGTNTNVNNHPEMIPRTAPGIAAIDASIDVSHLT